jgi:DNA-binding MarR family transcriptional regulator
MTGCGDGERNNRVDQLREDIVRFNRKIRTQNSGRHLLTPTQMQALGHLDRLGPMTARALADAEMVAPQTIARTVTFLEQQGMVARTTDPTDARAALISVTGFGHRTLQADRGKRSEWLAAALEEHCTPIEQELMFLAGTLLRRLADDTHAKRTDETAVVVAQ